jgi:protein involved in temperature-dependent protein secretion
VPGAYHGRGQRTFITDSGEVPLMELRALTIRQGVTQSGETAVSSHG